LCHSKGMNTVINIHTNNNNHILPPAAMAAKGTCLSALPFEIAALKPTQFIHAERRPVPGLEQYRVSSDGAVYSSGALLKTIKRQNAAPQVRLRRNGKVSKRTVSKLVALAFIPNPGNYDKVIHLDRNFQNCTIENLQWANTLQFFRHIKNLDSNDALLGPPRRRKKREPDWIDPLRVPIDEFPGYFITPSGVVYREAFIVKSAMRTNKSPKICLRLNNRHAKYAGVASLVATYFVPNPRNYTRVIFKDRNRHNCHYTNLAWVDNETWMFYCGTLKGGKKLVFTREEAIQRCTDVHMLNYYKSLDEYWLHECWKEIEAAISIADWPQLRSECYMYFIDRVQRFSILKNPLFVILSCVRNMRNKIRKEISPTMHASVVRKNDESLRNLSHLD